MNTDILTNAIATYPGFAFALGAATIWGARYVKKITTELDQIKTETNRGEQAAIMKIEDMADLLDNLERDVLYLTKNIEEDLAHRQVADLSQKEVLSHANKVMVDSIANKETFHDNLLNQFEELESMLDGFEHVGAVGQMMEQMRQAFHAIQAQQDELHHETLQLVNELQANLATVENIAREVGV